MTDTAGRAYHPGNPYKPVTGEHWSTYYTRMADRGALAHPDVQYFLSIWRGAMNYGNEWGIVRPKRNSKAKPAPARDLKVRVKRWHGAFWLDRAQVDEIMGPPEKWAEALMGRLNHVAV